MFPLIICISLISLTWATKPCTLLTSCAVEKCLDRMQLCSIEWGDYCTIVCQNVHCKARRESGRGRWSPSTGQVDKIMKSSSREEIFGNLVEKFDLVCIAAKCQSACQQCQACHYALEQMSALAQGEKTSGLCPKLESCAESCLVGDLPKVLSCIANRCNVHCYDGDCPSCKTISKRMFTMICTRHGMTKLPNINYDGTCPNFFNELSEEYVARRRRIAAQ